MRPKSHPFSAKIKIRGINPYVDVPAAVSASFGIRGSIPIVGSLNGIKIASTLIPIGDFRHILYLNMDMRKRAGVDVGDTVELSMKIDHHPLKPKLPDLLIEALSKDNEAKRAWDSLTPSKRKEILAYLNHLKGDETMERNVKKVLLLLRARLQKIMIKEKYK